MKTYRNRNRTTSGSSTDGVSSGRPIPSTSEWQSEEVKEGEGNIRVSISIGHSEDYGKNKFTVTVDHGLSCGQTPQEKLSAYNEARNFCMAKVEDLRKEVIDTLFSKQDLRSVK